MPSPVRLALALTLVPAVACSGDKGDSGSAGETWRMPDQGLGLPMADGADADLGEPGVAWHAAAQVVPGVDWAIPGVELPLSLWASLQVDRFWDEGSCPYTVTEGTATVYRSDCRTNEGYEWTGDVRVDDWEEDGWRWRRWDYELEVVADTDNPGFARIAIEGAAVMVDTDDSSFSRGVQANWRVEADEYWASQGTDAREATWQTLAVTGRDEATDSGVHRVDVAATAAGIGSYTLRSEALTLSSDCTVVPTGEAELEGRQASTLTYGETCARCAGWDGEGASADQACGS